jgi:hypothetical protein
VFAPQRRGHLDRRAPLWLLLVIGTPPLRDLLLSDAAYEKSWKLGNPTQPAPNGDP